jgi:IS5 family transposase
MKMVRKQVYITAEQEDELKAAAKRLGVTEAELIRRGIELVQREDERLAAARMLTEMLKKRAEEFPEGGGIDKFDREEVYAERLDRLGRILP